MREIFISFFCFCPPETAVDKKKTQEVETLGVRFFSENERRRAWTLPLSHFAPKKRIAFLLCAFFVRLVAFLLKLSTGVHCVSPGSVLLAKE